MEDDTKSLLAGLDSTPVLLQQAEKGDHVAAKELLEIAARQLETGGALDPEVTAWLAQGLARLAEDGDGKKAFGLAAPRGKRPASDEFQRLVAVFIHESKAGKHKALSADGETFGAYEQAAEAFGISPNTAADYYNRHIDSIRTEEQINRQLAED